VTKSACAVLRLPSDCVWQVLVLEEVRLVVGGGNGGKPFVNVGGIAYQGRAVMDQHVAARRTRIKGRSGNSQNIWSLIQRIAGGYLAPGFSCGFNYHCGLG
jgi:hypothetical protein